MHICIEMNYLGNTKCST